MTDPKEGGLCWRCRKPVAQEDNFCRFCGAPLVKFPWYYQHWGILVSFFFLGPFTLVLAWMSPSISRTAKWAYTVVSAWMTYELVVGCIHAYQILNAAVSGMVSGNLPTGIIPR